MKRGFLKFYEALKKGPELKIPGIKQKIKKLAPESLALLIYPILEDNSRHVRIKNMKFDPLRIRKFYELTKKYQELNIGRILLYGPDIKKAYEIIKSMNCIYIDELNTLIIKPNEIHLSVTSHWYEVSDEIEDLAIRALYFDFDYVRSCGSVISNSEMSYSGPDDIYYGDTFVDFAELPVMFILLLDKFGPAHKELAFVNGMKYTNPDKQEILINNCHTKLVKDYIERVCLVHKRESRQIFSPINELLDDMSIDVIADYTYREARNIQLTMNEEQ